MLVVISGNNTLFYSNLQSFLNWFSITKNLLKNGVDYNPSVSAFKNVLTRITMKLLE